MTFLKFLLANGNKIASGVNIKKLPIILYNATLNPNGEFNICLIELNGIKLNPLSEIPLSIRILSLKFANVKPNTARI